MNSLAFRAINGICTKSHFAPNLRTFRSVHFNRALASYWKAQEQSASAIYDAVLEEIYECRVGNCHWLCLAEDDPDIPIDFDAVDLNGDRFLDRAFGLDPERTINRYTTRATKRYKNRLSRQLYDPVLVLHYAREIRQSRLLATRSR